MALQCVVYLLQWACSVRGRVQWGKLKLQKQNNTVLNAEKKFGDADHAHYSLEDLAQFDLTQLGELAIELLNDKNLEVSKVRPFFWTLVEAYVDRFQLYPFDASKALFNDLELKGYPREAVLTLIEQLESQYEGLHGSSLRDNVSLKSSSHVLNDEMKALRDSLKYAAKVAELDE